LESALQVFGSPGAPHTPHEAQKAPGGPDRREKLGTPWARNTSGNPRLIGGAVAISHHTTLRDLLFRRRSRKCPWTPRIDCPGRNRDCSTLDLQESEERIYSATQCILDEGNGVSAPGCLRAARAPRSRHPARPTRWRTARCRSRRCTCTPSARNNLALRTPRKPGCTRTSWPC